MIVMENLYHALNHARVKRNFINMSYGAIVTKVNAANSNLIKLKT